MIRIERELCGIPLWLLEEYLLELGGKLEGRGRVVGSGWTVQLEQIEDVVVGSLRVGQISMILEASPSAYEQFWQKLEKKLLRAGG